MTPKGTTERCPTCGSDAPEKVGSHSTRARRFNRCNDDFHKASLSAPSAPQPEPLTQTEGDPWPLSCPSCNSADKQERHLVYRGWGDTTYMRNYFACYHPWHFDKWQTGRLDLMESAPSEPVRELVEALRTAKGSVCEFLAIRQACIDVGGAKGPLDQELIERLAEMQIGVVDRAELSAAEAERVLARYQKV